MMGRNVKRILQLHKTGAAKLGRLIIPVEIGDKDESGDASSSSSTSSNGIRSAPTNDSHDE